VDRGVLSATGILALDLEVWVNLNLVDCIFEISGGKLSHPSSIMSKWSTPSSIMSKWSTVDFYARACVQLEIEGIKALLACM
jgi:hypothetical protein